MILNSVIQTRASSWRRCALLPLLILALIFSSTLFVVRGIGGWLVVANPLEHAQAIVVLGGHLPFRAMEAASLYRKSWAPEIWLTRGERSSEEQALAQLGIQLVREETYNRDVLEKLGVPPRAIRLLDGGTHNTADDVLRIFQEIKRVGGDRIIIVTSKSHSRRVKATWRALVGSSPRAVVRYAAEDPYDPSHWWRYSGSASAVTREVFGLLNVWLGFPIR